MRVQTKVFSALCTVTLLSLGCGSVEDEGLTADDIPIETPSPEEAFKVDHSTSEEGLELTQKGCRIPRSDVRGHITLSSGYWGNWQSCVEYCPAGSYAYIMRVRSEPALGGGDDTALNGVSLYCYNRSNAVYRGYVDSHAGYWGNWGSHASCRYTSNPIRGGMLQLEPPQGGGDDTALNRMYGFCRNWGMLAPSAHTAWGNWQPHKMCPNGQAVCGIRTRMEPPQGGGDDTALNGVQFACCSF